MKPNLRGQNIGFIFFGYWICLLIWGNFCKIANNDIIDLCVKCLILVVFSALLFVRFDGCMHNSVSLAMFCITMGISFCLETSYSMNILVFYGYVVLVTILIFGVCDRQDISIVELVPLLKCILYCVLVFAIYSVVVNFSVLKSAIHFSGGYGNEISSFFASNHEYAMYLSAAMISCVFLVQYEKRIRYLFFFCLLGINLLLTFSRTSIAALIGFFVVYFICDRRVSVQRVFLGCMALVIFVIAGCPPITHFLLNTIVNKGGSARSILYQLAVDIFRQSDFRNKLFGNGIEWTRNIFLVNTNHGSVHNSYLQVLLYFGVVGLGWLIIVILKLGKQIVKTIAKDRFVGRWLLAILTWCVVEMVPNTHLIFTSPIDCFFLTMFGIVFPKYVCNHICMTRNVINS